MIFSHFRNAPYYMRLNPWLKSSSTEFHGIDHLNTYQSFANKVKLSNTVNLVLVRTVKNNYFSMRTN